MSFTDWHVTVVNRRCRRKHFTFLLSSPERLRQFHPNLAQSIVGWWEFKFVEMKDQVFFPRKDDSKIVKISFQHLKIFPWTLSISTTLGISIRLFILLYYLLLYVCLKQINKWMKVIEFVCSTEGPHLSPRGGDKNNFLINLLYIHNFSRMFIAMKCF